LSLWGTLRPDNIRVTGGLPHNGVVSAGLGDDGDFESSGGVACRWASATASAARLFPIIGVDPGHPVTRNHSDNRDPAAYGDCGQINASHVADTLI